MPHGRMRWIRSMDTLTDQVIDRSIQIMVNKTLWEELLMIKEKLDIANKNEDTITSRRSMCM